MLGGGGANLGRRLGLRKRDLGFGLLRAPGDEFLQPLAGLDIQLLGLSARLGDDGGGVASASADFFSKLANSEVASWRSLAA